MPPSRTNSASQAKRPRPPFNPPRPRQDRESAALNTKAPTTSNKAKAQANKSTSKSKSASSKAKAPAKKATTITLSSDVESDETQDDAVSDDDANDTTTQSFRRRASTPSFDAPEPPAADESKPPPIPAKLLTRLLYEAFEDKDMKIGREAMNAFGKYMETFVREALARAVYERQDADGAGLGGDGFLQVEDLEKLAPQLLLDF